MLSEHPHIRTMYVSEVNLSDRTNRRLIVESNLVMPASGRIEDNRDLLKLHNYLENVAVYDFDDLDEVEIKTMPAKATSSDLYHYV